MLVSMLMPTLMPVLMSMLMSTRYVGESALSSTWNHLVRHAPHLSSVPLRQRYLTTAPKTEQAESEAR